MRDQDERDEREPEGRRPEDEPSSGVVTAFGRQLKLLRLRAGLDRHEFGRLVGYAAQSVASFEQGRRIPPPRFIDRADEVLDAGGVLVAMKEEVARARYPAFFRDAARLEATAQALCVYAALAIPGLLQTEDYARAVFRMQRPLLDDAVIEQRLESRLARQEIFERRPAPLLSFIIEEVVLRKPIGGTAVLRGQLEHVLLVGQHRNVEIQVMPTDREDHAALDGPFNLIDAATGQRIAYTEVQNDSRLHTEVTKIRELESRYGILRSQALTPSESLAFVEKLLGEG
ncbi:DNA-binding protein [Streptomyces sp. CB03234]|uniref:helix-turn-helix domain-containing protein n=1 Tax=Streptomyces sp. (strain CB03234) TaxID=1703937 RepID=UPI00093A167A|nr:helix-turn-helix transcriptional regulator [Streptomyces sp. CB03234]OKK04992.1 DNA-binding protein [Streptomyces sp. CB03234]